MNPRTAWLAAGAIAVFALYFVDQGYRSLIEEPSERYQSRLDAIADATADANVAQVTGRRLEKQLEEYAARALPYEADIARSRYQEWLLNLVDKHQMQSASVDADAPRPVEIRGRVNRRARRLVGHRIQYALRARTTLSHLTNFLYDFHHSAQLHKIRGFALTPLVDGNRLDLSMDIETLTLEATERDQTLSNLVRAESNMAPRASYDDFVERNLFAKGFSKILADIRLNAITRGRNGQREAWFSVGTPARTQRIGIEGSISIPLHQVKVVGFAEESVQLEVNGLACSIRLGQTLADVFGEKPPNSPPDLSPAAESPVAPSPSDTIVNGTTANLDGEGVPLTVGTPATSSDSLAAPVATEAGTR